jgi:hypothetical protein
MPDKLKTFISSSHMRSETRYKNTLPIEFENKYKENKE